MLKETRRIVFISLIVVALVAIGGILYLNLSYSRNCQNYACWQEQMEKCSRTRFVNEVTEASWGYEIKGKKDGGCSIDVTLLIAKEGELGITKLMGKEMNCNYPLGVSTYPEQDLGKCHGILKEELLTIKLNKYHAYLLENLGKLSEGLEKVV